MADIRHDKRSRQSLIQEIISHQAVETQEELADLLEARGIQATQATVSRDIKEMGLLKVPFRERHRYALPESGASGSAERMKRILREVLLGYVVSENLVVVKTVSAGAEVVAEAIDAMQWPEVAGTVAGENTVLVVARSRADAPGLARRLEELK
ncbi:MAG: arginine repressor [Thermaerobacter sp.]|nr:arginine repressor [Thermaerobacter sp.]